MRQSNKTAQRTQRVFDAQKALWLGKSLFAPPLINLTIVNSKALNTKMMPGRGQASHYEFGFVTTQKKPPPKPSTAPTKPARMSCFQLSWMNSKISANEISASSLLTLKFEMSFTNRLLMDDKTLLNRV